jgi:hypothetical protein
MRTAPIRSRFGAENYTKSFLPLREHFRTAAVIRSHSARDSSTAMYGFSTNFIAGLLLGALIALLAPLAGIDLAAGGVAPRVETSAHTKNVQTVNRAAKSDRLPLPVRAKQDADNAKPTNIPVGCDPAFSPLTKSTSNFSSRCLA